MLIDDSNMEKHVQDWTPDESQATGLRKPRQVYDMIKQSYVGLKEPDLSRITTKLHRDA